MVRMIEFLFFVGTALAGILVDRIMGHHKPWVRENFPKGVEVEKRGLLMVSFMAFTCLFLLLSFDTPSMTTWSYACLAHLLLLSRMFRFEWWYYDFGHARSQKV